MDRPYGWMTFESEDPNGSRYFSFSGQCGQRLLIYTHLSRLFLPNGMFLDEKTEYVHCQSPYYASTHDPRTFILDGGAKSECPACLSEIAERLYESYLLSRGSLEFLK